MILKKLKLAMATLLLTSISLVGCTFFGCQESGSSRYQERYQESAARYQDSTPRYEESTGQYVDSATITARVKARLLADSEVGGFAITVKTYKNTVQLSGFVNSASQKRRAVRIAASVPGVASVKDSLVVKSY